MDDDAPSLKQSWASLASDLDGCISPSLRCEFLDDTEGSEYIPSFPGRISTGSSADSPRTLEEPVFGFISSPFAASPEEIQEWRTLFDDYVPPSPDTAQRKYPPSETPSERRREDALLSAWEEAEERETQATSLLMQQRMMLSNPIVYLQPPPPPPPRSPQTNTLSSDCRRCGAKIGRMRDGEGVRCDTCGEFFAVDPWCGLLGVPSNGPMSPRQHSRQWKQRRRCKQRTNMLHEFKQRNGKGFCLSDLWGHMLFLSRDQLGSRFLQRELSQAGSPEQERYFYEISRHVLSIAGDVFGNFIIQVLLESSSPSIVARLVQIFKPHMVDLSTRPYGCRVVQKSIETLSYKHKCELVTSLEGSVESCANNEHGNHVIQRCLQYLHPQDISFIYSSITEKTRSMSRDRYGCRVVQRAIEERDPNAFAEPIRRRITTLAVELAFDEFANFVVQKLLRLGTQQTVGRIVESFMPHLIKLSCQKYPSNVVETTLAVCTPETAQRIKHTLLGMDLPDNRSHTASILRDRFGRYVIEKLIKFCTDAERCMIRQIAEATLQSVTHDTRQRNLAKRMQRLLNAL